MGLTVHYTITPPPEWAWEEIRDRLVAIGEEIKKSTGFLEVNEVREFQWVSTRWQPEVPEEYHGALSQSYRLTTIRVLPVLQVTQRPKRILLLPTMPGNGSEPFHIGCAEYPDTVNCSRAVAIHWRQVLANRRKYPELVRAFQAFVKKYRLRVIRSESQWHRVYKIGSNVRFVFSDDAGDIIRYSSAPDEQRLAFIFRGGEDMPLALVSSDAETRFTRTMRCDWKRLHGRGLHKTEPARTWQSFCKTQYARNPEYGGVANFLRVHQGVCAALKICEEHGFAVQVNDEGGFWGNWDTGALIRRIGASPEDRERLSGVLQNTGAR